MGLIWIRGCAAKVLEIDARSEPVLVTIEPVVWARIRKALDAIMERESKNEDSSGID